MIKSFRHKGLKKLFETGVSSGINPSHKNRTFEILKILNVCTRIEQLNLPGFRLHKLKGNLKDCYSVSISGNWRLTFKFDGKDVLDVDYVDYH